MIANTSRFCDSLVISDILNTFWDYIINFVDNSKFWGIFLEISEIHNVEKRELQVRMGIKNLIKNNLNSIVHLL